METKLDWNYDDRTGEWFAAYSGLKIRAVQDSDAQNPFKDDDNAHWPMRTISLERNSTPTDYGYFDSFGDILRRFGPAGLVHNQHAIAEALGWGAKQNRIEGMMENYVNYIPDTIPPAKYCRDFSLLDDCFTTAWDEMGESDQREACCELYKILEIPHICVTSRGHSQGDEVEIFVVATPEKQKIMGVTNVTEADMQAQADLYGDWCWGNCYGYIIEKIQKSISICCECDHVQPGDEDACARCGEMTYEAEDTNDPEEIEDGSCFGYFGTDFDKSGLEESAMEAVDAYIRTQSDTVVNDVVTAPLEAQNG